MKRQNDKPRLNNVAFRVDDDVAARLKAIREYKCKLADVEIGDAENARSLLIRGIEEFEREMKRK